MTPRALFTSKPVPTPETWTPRQRAAWEYLCARQGVRAYSLGRHLHRHGFGQDCPYCEDEGLSVLRSAALKPHVIRRRTGLWQPREARYRAHDETTQGGDIPF